MQQQQQGLLDFPLAVLARVLKHVPTQQRLSQCALVCQHFAAAAALATSSISICSRRSCYNTSCKQRYHLPNSKLPALQAWIEQHAGQLASMCYCGDHQLQLPCADLLQLTSLELDGQMLLLQDTASTSTGAAGMLLRSGRKKTAADPARLRAAPAVGQHGSNPTPQLLPKLQRLELSRCELSSVQPLLQLSRLTSLTSLNLGDGTVSQGGVAEQPSSAQDPQEQEQFISTALCTLLPQLKRLVEVKLDSDVTGTGLACVTKHLGRLPQLRSLHVGISDNAAHTDDLLADLPSSLTRLVVWDMRRDPSTADMWDFELPAIPPASLPRQLPQLSTLQELELDGAVFYSSLLRETPDLQRLVVHSCKLLPGGDAAADKAAAAALLAAIGCLKHLTYLCIKCDRSDFDYDQNLNAGDPAAYTALTVSSALHSLTYAGVDKLPLPWGAMEHAFPQGMLLPFLTELCIEGVGSCSEAVGYQDGDGYGFGFMDADGLPAVFAACPALVSLSIRNALEPGDLTPLLHLPASVESIDVGGQAWGDAAAGVLGQLMQLRSISWEGSDGLTDVGLQELTALQRLTWLHVFCAPGLSAELLDDGAHIEDGGSGTLHLKVRPDQSDRPVWQQLCDRLDNSPVLSAQRLQQHKRDKEQLQEQLEQMQKRITDLEEENADLQQQLHKRQA